MPKTPFDLRGFVDKLLLTLLGMFLLGPLFLIWLAVHFSYLVIPELALFLRAF